MIILGMIAMLGFVTGCSDDDETFVEKITQATNLYTNARVIHASNNAFTIPVDIALNSAIGIEALGYGESSGYARIIPGIYFFEVLVSGTDTVVLDGEFLALTGVDFTLFAIDEGEGGVTIIGSGPDPEEGALFENRYSDDEAVRIRFVHAGTDIPPVDVKAGSPLNTATVFGDVEFGDIEEYLTIDAGTYEFYVTLAGVETAVFQFEPVDLIEGDVLTVVALGTLDEEDDADVIVRVFIDNGDGDQYIDLEPVVIPNGT